jgi:hypothetical protein
MIESALLNYGCSKFDASPRVSIDEIATIS